MWNITLNNKRRLLFHQQNVAVMTSVCSRRKFEPLMLNSLLRTWWKSSHEHCTIPEHSLYIVWNKSNLSCMTIVWCLKHSHSQCKLHTKTILNVNCHMCTRQQKRDGIIEHVKVKTLAFKNCNVASRLRISRLWRTFTIWRKLLFLGVLFHKFSYQRWKYSRQTGRCDTLVFESRQRR